MSPQEVNQVSTVIVRVCPPCNKQIFYFSRVHFSENNYLFYMTFKYSIKTGGNHTRDQVFPLSRIQTSHSDTQANKVEKQIRWVTSITEHAEVTILY
jgi:hypothetical protein